MNGEKQMCEPADYRDQSPTAVEITANISALLGIYSEIAFLPPKNYVY